MNKAEDNAVIIDENKLAIIDSRGSNTTKEMLAEELNDAFNYEKQQDSVPEVSDKNERNKSDGTSTPLSQDVADKLTTGLLSMYVDDLQNIGGSLTELTRNQSIIIETMQQENTRFTECINLYHLDDLFAKAKHYHSKLQYIKKEMTMLHERSNKLKRRALKLQQQKQKEALQREQQREREMEHEKQLIPKVVSKS